MHALVQETVYAGLATVRRARLHAKVGSALEDLYGADDEEHVPELARHFSHAINIGEATRALQYAVRAADLSTARFAYDQAEVHLTRALDALTRLPAGPERDRRELDVHVRRTVVLALIRGYASSEVAQAGTRAHHLASHLGDTGHLSASLCSLWGLSVVGAQFDVAVGFGRQLHDLGQRTGDALAGVFFQHPSVFSRDFAALATWLLGDSHEATSLSRDAIRLARQLDHPFTLTLALFFDAWLASARG